MKSEPSLALADAKITAEVPAREVAGLGQPVDIQGHGLLPDGVHCAAESGDGGDGLLEHQIHLGALQLGLLQDLPVNGIK